MKKTYFLGLLLCAQTLWLSAQPLDYAGWKSRAEQLMADYKSERARGVTTPWHERDKAARAGEAWMAAAQQCQDVTLRFQALEQAALAFLESRSSVTKEQVEALTLARDLVGAPEPDRARLGLRLAYVTRQRKDFEAAANLSGAQPETRGEAWHEVALSYQLEVKNDPKSYLQMAESYEKAAAAYAESKPGRAASEMGQAKLAAEQIPDRKLAIAVIDRIHKTQLGYKRDQSALGQAMVRLSWAASLEKLGAVDRAQGLRRELGKLATAPLDKRVEGWTEAAEAELRRQRPAQALKDLEQASLLRQDNFVFSQRLARRRMDVLTAQKDHEGVLKTWAQLAAHPKATPRDRDDCRLQQVVWLRWLKRDAEADALLEQIIAQPGSPQTLAQACEARVARRIELKDYAGARQELARLEPRFSPVPVALVDLRGRCLAAQGHEAEALDLWESAHRDVYGRIYPSQHMIDGAEQVFQGYLAARQLEAAAALRNRARRWYVQPILYELWNAEYAVVAGDKAGARQALEKARGQLGQFSGTTRAQLEKRIAEISARGDAL